MTCLPPFPPQTPDRIDDRHRADHGWVVAHLIGLIDYCEAEGMIEAEQILIEATERLAPILNGHRLARLRAGQAQPLTPVAREFASAILHLPQLAGMGTPYVPT